tara:strand:+ start:2436 stop:4970 length:2535 start_codon:yes stop_codon:yes gene_type:complete
MAVRIDIPGIGEVTAENAASEATLRSLVKILGGPASPLNPASGRGLVSSESAKNIAAVGSASAEAAEEISGLGKAAGGVVSGAFNLLLSAIMSVVGAVPNFANTLLSGDQSMRGFFSNFPLIGPALGQIGGILDEQVDQFRDLTSVGASFGNNMFGITRAAAEASMATEALAKVINSDGLVLRQFGSSVGDGAKNFARFSKELRYSDAGTRLMAMGFTTEELNDNLIAYSDLQTMYGRRQNMTQQELINGTINYSKELDRIAKITGKSRKDVEEQQKMMARDIRIQKQMADGTSALTKNLQLLPKEFTAVQGSLIDIADGVPTDELTRSLMFSSDTFRAQAKNFGDMSEEQANNFLVQVTKEVNDKADKMTAAQLDALRGSGNQLYEAFTQAGALKSLQNVDGGFINREQKARDSLTERATEFNRTIESLAAKFKVFLLDSGILDKLADAFEKFLPTTEEAGKMFDELLVMFEQKVMPMLKKTYDEIMNSDMLIKGWEKLKNWAGDTYDYFMKTDWTKKLQEWSEGTTKYWNIFKDGMKDIIGWFESVDWAGLSDKFKKFYNDTKEIFGAVGEIDWAGLIQDLKEGIKNVKEFFAPGGDFEQMWDKVTKFVNETMTKAENFFNNTLIPFWDNLVQMFEDGTLLDTIIQKVTNAVKIGWDKLMDAIPWGEIATVLGGAFVALFTNLNPWARIVAGIVAGVTAYFDWENVKSYFVDLKDSLVKSMQKLWDSFASLFDIDWSALLQSITPDWVKKGIGAVSNLFSSSNSGAGSLQGSIGPDPTSLIEKDNDASTGSKIRKEMRTADNTSTEGAFAGGGISNSAVERLIAETQKNTKAVKALNNNAHG